MKTIDEISTLSPGDMVIYMSDDELVIGSLVSYEHTYVHIGNHPKPLAENLVYEYKPDRLEALNMSHNMRHQIADLLQAGETVVLGS